MTKKTKPETLDGFPMFTRIRTGWEYGIDKPNYRSLIDIDLNLNDGWRVYVYISVAREFGATRGYQPEVFDTAEQAALFCMVRGWLA